MMTRDQWNRLTQQQQFDYARLLEDTVDGFVEADAEVSGHANAALLNLRADSDLLHGMVELDGRHS